MTLKETLSNFFVDNLGLIEKFGLRAVISLLILIAGIFLGKLLGFGLKKLSRNIDLDKHLKGSFVDLFIFVIRWSIYILFINVSLNYLGVPALTNFFTAILITIPTFTASLILLSIGFSLAYFLKKVIINSEVTTAGSFSEIIFYFVIYIFGIYTLKTALYSFPLLTNNIILLFSVAYFVGVTYKVLRK